MSSDWLSRAPGMDNLEGETRKALASVEPMTIPKGKILFCPGDEVPGFAILLSGRVDVYLTGAGGRDILLYSILPGETCVQTTLGLLGEEDYDAEAVAETDVEVAMIPKGLFMSLLDSSSALRTYVFHSFAERLRSLTRAIEKVAFVKIEERLATALLERADDDGVVHNTHQELATAIGSVREVVSRRLEPFASKGLIALERGAIRIVDRDGLRDLITPMLD